MKRAVKVGTRLGPYELTEPLGSGGAGVVFRARHVETGKLVAIKTMTPSAAINEEIHKRFVREISVAQKLGHENVVAYDDCGLDEDILYYTMEVVPWGTLKEVLSRRGKLQWKEAVECGIHICRGLEHLHQAGIVHRDLKPANIFLSDRGSLKLGDFGLARDLASFGLTVEGHTVGTPKYFSPEQAMARDDLDGRTDLYALGCILFEMLAGRPPFVAESRDMFEMVELMKKHVEAQPPSVVDFAPQCPTSLAMLIDNLLKKVPSERPASAAEVETALQVILDSPQAAYVERQSTQDSPKGNELDQPQLDQSQPAKSLTERLVSEDAPQQLKNKRWMIAVAAVVLLVILVAVASRGS